MKINENVSENSKSSVSKQPASALADGNPKKPDWDQVFSQSAKAPEHHSQPKTSSQHVERFSGLKILFVLIVAVLFFGLGFAIGHQWEIRDDQTPEITEQIIATKIEDCSELATSKLSYNGFVRYEQGNIPFINRKAFAMGYRADVSAGIDLSQAQIIVEGKDIKVKLPASTIQSIKIDPNSIEFYDNEYSLFAWDNKEDTVEALNAAQADVETKMNRIELLSKADEQAKDVIEDMLKELTFGRDGYNIEVTVTERPQA